MGHERQGLLDKSTTITTVVTTAPSNESIDRFTGSELVIGLVGAVGADLKTVRDILVERLKVYKYEVKPIKVTQDVFPIIYSEIISHSCEYERIKAYMTAGNKARNNSGYNEILALGAASIISEQRSESNTRKGEKTVSNRCAYIIDSLKHPKEVEKLRDIYSEGFFLIGVYSDRDSRIKILTDLLMNEKQAEELIQRDEDEHLPYGQLTRDTFHLSDFFIHVEEGITKVKYKNDIHRILNIIFGEPYATPTNDEFAMFMAFASSLRSANLSRQVGAVIVNDCQEIISMGFNDCPKFGGGLYQPIYDKINEIIIDFDGGRDHTIKHDSNTKEVISIIKEVADLIKSELETDIDETGLRGIIEKSRVKDITEFGRSVHAEMEALLCCSRNGINMRGATLYCTTYPCHNCAKHIVAAGIQRVVYIEPHHKSQAIKLHPDSICSGINCSSEKVQFQPFIGVGPRRFFDLFSTKLSSGYPIKRKNENGSIIDWDPGNAELRMQLLPVSYIHREEAAVRHFMKYIEGGDPNAK